MSTVGWVDARAGASGDMLLGAALDAGADLAVVQTAIDALGVEPITLTTEPVTRGGFAALRAMVRTAQSPAHRTWREVRALLDTAALDPQVRSRAVDTFTRLARAEAAAHGTTPDEVHFHEVGALDSIADVVGVCAALVDLDVQGLSCSPVALGTGTVVTAHGPMPVPGPAVVRLLAEASAPTFAGAAPWEACTPTGAALLATWTTAWGGQPSLTVTATGAGSGARGSDDDAALAGLDPRPPANVLRLLIGTPAQDSPAATGPGSRGQAVLVETNVDDLDPRLWPHVVERLLATGASDAWLTPIVMKKGRAAHSLHVLTPHDVLEEVVRTVLTETTAIGLRTTVVGKRALERDIHAVDVDGVRVRVKVARLDGRVVNVQPELDDVLAAADSLGLPAKAVLARATTLAHAAGLDR